ncbi:glycosyltransferase family 4 protein [Ralstonia sp. CHL-2022]|uniref:Glycosyltransferase family 4 protein n=1 Tax=Ralstonia mojiangensis TaxID=2953895 RepID=A0ABT2L3Y7_9RALS|nr:glycosyltransferase family 4 protein [Ralstonia mojiangensis]MCT7297523.1 glycosyltransferase family 4 protein [Ralstonia mojiangensis]MCT7310115.1 glycosyltransferase family 4 protein [Ralstonia mojiangensis]
MRVVLVSQYFWPETFRINEVVESLSGLGCKVTVLTGQPNYPSGVIEKGYKAFSLRSERRNAVTILRVPMIPRGRGSGMRLVANYLSFVVSATLFGPWLLRGQQFDVVLVYAPSPILQAIPAIWLKWIKRARLVTWVQDLWPESLRATGFVRNQRILNAVACAVRWIYRRNDLLLVQSHAFVKPVSEMAGCTPVIYHPNPGELAFSTSQDDRISPLELEAGFNIVFAGNLGTVQALDTVLAAAQLLRDDPDVRFVFIGSGSRSEWLQREIQRLGLDNARILGRFASTDMPAILAQASALLVSLVRDPIMSQTVPSKVQAYLAAGRPIIACMDGEGARVVVESGAGVGCPAQDAQALADAVRQLRNMSPSDLEQMAERGRSYYQRNFSPELLAERLVRVLSAKAGEKLDATVG